MYNKVVKFSFTPTNISLVFSFLILVSVNPTNRRYIHEFRRSIINLILFSNDFELIFNHAEKNFITQLTL